MKDFEDEVHKLDKLAKYVIGYLVVCALMSLFLGANNLAQSSDQLVTIMLLGFSGSATAALTSSLDRYSIGFELDSGMVYPLEAKGQKFNRRFSTWLIVRPFLGAIVSPVFVWGVNLIADDPSAFLEGNALGFTAFMAGLLAKSVLDLIKNLFKNVFRA